MSNLTTSKNRLRDLFPSQFSSEFDSFLNQVLAPSGLRASHTPAGLWEDDDAYHIELDVPGVSRDDIDITLDKGTLTVSAERKHEEQDKTRKGWREERFYGKVSRAFSLTDTIDPESIAASIDDGVLRVSVAKIPAAQPKKIEIR